MLRFVKKNPKKYNIQEENKNKEINKTNKINRINKNKKYIK